MRDVGFERDGARAQRVALCSLRRAVTGMGCCGDAGICPFGIGRDLAGIRVRFLAVWDGSAPLCREALRVGRAGEWGVSKDERRLLKALAAAQSEDAWLLDNYLYKLALAPERRRRLAGAVEALAAALAVQGYWLERPGERLPIPAPALMVARTHGHDLDMARIAWP
ncbi:hypothetical protein [Acidocella sp.]|uniref:hypothetical protein n=1 Tax=Acidocella sp. TaxID=50710 RepID=UPI003D0870FA